MSRRAGLAGVRRSGHERGAGGYPAATKDGKRHGMEKRNSRSKAAPARSDNVSPRVAPPPGPSLASGGENAGENQSMKSTSVTLITGLGVGDEKRFGEWRYAEVEYELRGERSGKKPLIAQALCDLIPRVRDDGAEVTRAVFLGAPKVEEAWWKSGLLKRALPGIDLAFVSTPEGKSMPELWEITSALTSLLEADEQEEPGEKRHYYIEVTLGYRAMPILVASAINLALARWAEQRATEPPRVTMLYGAWEAKASDGSMPIWDLTDLVAAGRWVSAIDAVGAQGQARPLEATAASLAGSWGESSRVTGLAGAASQALDDVAYGRLGGLVQTTAPALRTEITGEAGQELRRRVPAAAPSLDGLEATVAPLCADDLVGPGGQRATVAFARLCSALGRHADEAAALREAIVTHYGRSTRRVPLLEPTARGFVRQRERVTAELSELESRARRGSDAERTAFLDALPPALRAPLEHLAPLETLRGDLARLGFAENSAGRSDLHRGLVERMDRLGALLEGPAPADLFVNLSDTPVQEWSPEQTEATRALGLGEPTELAGGPPAELDADIDDEQIEQLARDLAVRAVAQGAAGACVDTDASLNFALVAELQARGVRCFAPATRKAQVDGRTQAQFARWRPYARPTDEA